MNLKAMHEQRAALVQQMNDLIAAADTETRALSEEESTVLTSWRSRSRHWTPPLSGKSVPAACAFLSLRLRPNRRPSRKSGPSPTMCWARCGRTAPASRT